METEEIESQLELCKMVHRDTIHAALHKVKIFAFYNYSFTPEILSTSRLLKSCYKFWFLGGLRIKGELQPFNS